jgi:hypothetical protein
MNRKIKSYDWSLPIAWLLLCTASMYTAGYLNFYMSQFINWSLAICFLGAAQSILLIHMLDRPWRWLVLSYAGWLIAYILQSGLYYLDLPSEIYTLSIGLSIGLFVGILQSLVISSRLVNRIIWTLASVIGWSLPFIYLAAAESGLLGPGTREWLYMGLYDTPLASVIINFVIGLSVGLTTGIVLAYLLYKNWKKQKPIKPMPEPETSAENV